MKIPAEVLKRLPEYPLHPHTRRLYLHLYQLPQVLSQLRIPDSVTEELGISEEALMRGVQQLKQFRFISRYNWSDNPLHHIQISDVRAWISPDEARGLLGLPPAMEEHEGASSAADGGYHEVEVVVQVPEPELVRSLYQLLRDEGAHHGLEELTTQSYTLKLTLGGYAHREADAEGFKQAIERLEPNASFKVKNLKLRTAEPESS